MAGICYTPSPSRHSQVMFTIKYNFNWLVCMPRGGFFYAIRRCYKCLGYFHKAREYKGTITYILWVGEYKGIYYGNKNS